MQLLNKKVNPIQNITFVAMMASVSIVFVLIAHFLPYLLFLLVFLLSLSSALVSLFCQKRYLLIYVLVTLSICSLIDISDCLFYIFPSIITGFLFGLMVNNNMSRFYIILIATLIHTIYMYVSIPLVNLFTQRDIVMDMAKLFSLESHQYISYIEVMFIFVISLLEVLICCVVIEALCSRFIELNQENNHTMYTEITIFISIIMMTLFAFLVKELSYVALGIAIYSASYLLIVLLSSRKKWINICLLLSAIIFVFIFAVFYRMIDKPLGLLLISVYPFAVSIIGIIHRFNSKKSII